MEWLVRNCMPSELINRFLLSANNASYAGFVSICLGLDVFHILAYGCYSLRRPQRLQDLQVYTFRSEMKPVLVLPFHIKVYLFAYASNFVLSINTSLKFSVSRLLIASIYSRFNLVSNSIIFSPNTRFVIIFDGLRYSIICR